MNISNLRQDYSQRALDVADTHPNPLIQFKNWFQDAIEAQVLEPNAMTVCTASREGKPSARVLLLKEVTEQGFVFFTNYESRKGQELDKNPHIALVFNWLDLQRQIRIEGTVQRIAAHLSDDYFHSRPRGSQLGAIASPQSSPVPNREYLESAFQFVETHYANVSALPRPVHWGGYEVLPTAIEFWQGRPSRLHDRILYVLLDNGEWARQRLAP